MLTTIEIKTGVIKHIACCAAINSKLLLGVGDSVNSCDLLVSKHPFDGLATVQGVLVSQWLLDPERKSK